MRLFRNIVDDVVHIEHPSMQHARTPWAVCEHGQALFSEQQLVEVLEGVPTCMRCLGTLTAIWRMASST